MPTIFYWMVAMHYRFPSSRPAKCFAALVLFPLVSLESIPAHAQGNLLFERLPSAALATADAASDPAQRRQLDSLRQSPAAVSIELVRMNVQALQAPTAALALGAAPVEAVRRDRVVRDD